VVKTGGILFGVLCLALVVHLTVDKLEPVFANAVPAWVAPIKETVFFLIVGLFAFPIVRDGWSIFRRAAWRGVVTTFAVAAGVVILSFALTYQPAPLGLGVDYSLRSLSPFTQVADWQNTRLLMPAFSYLLFLRGGAYFYAFFLGIVFVFIAALHVWNQRHAHLALWEFFSICTASFVIFHFQAPGYPDVLVYLFFLLVMLDDFSPAAKLSALVLALVTFESSIFVGAVLALRYLPRRERLLYLLAIGVYGLVWLAAWNFDALAILSSRNVDGLSGLGWVLQQPGRELLGLFMGYKALWVVIVWGAASAFQSGRRSEGLFILMVIGAAIFMTTSAVDTSRLMGYAFPALLTSLAILTDPAASTRTGRRILSSLFLINLAIPSVYVGLNSGARVLRGIYGRMVRFVIK
jgi:hypothetical protein